MKHLLFGKYALTFSFLLFATGATLVFLYLMRAERTYSLQTTLRENFVLKLIIVLTGLLSGSLNLMNVYREFCSKMALLRAIKLMCLNFPLLVLQVMFVYCFFVLNAYA